VQNLEVSNIINKEGETKMYCSSCGDQILPDAVFCPKCGVSNKKVDATNVVDKNSIGYNILSFIIPIVGLVLYFMFKKETPIKAKGVLTWGIIGFVINLLILL
jgi:uncharacterized membrane protein YvbJ